MGKRKRRYRKCFDAFVQTVVHVPTRLYEADTRPEKRKELLQVCRLALPLGRALYPAGFCTLQEVGLAMINAVSKGYPEQILEVKDIVKLAKA